MLPVVMNPIQLVKKRCSFTEEYSKSLDSQYEKSKRFEKDQERLITNISLHFFKTL